MNMKSETPCFDRKTGIGCPDRCAGCAASCEKWAAYESKRNMEYRQKLESGETDAYMIERRQKVRKAMKRHRIIKGG